METTRKFARVNTHTGGFSEPRTPRLGELGATPKISGAATRRRPSSAAPSISLSLSSPRASPGGGGASLLATQDSVRSSLGASPSFVAEAPRTPRGASGAFPSPPDAPGGGSVASSPRLSPGSFGTSSRFPVAAAAAMRRPASAQPRATKPGASSVAEEKADALALERAAEAAFEAAAIQLREVKIAKARDARAAMELEKQERRLAESAERAAVLRRRKDAKTKRDAEALAAAVAESELKNSAVKLRREEIAAERAAAIKRRALKAEQLQEAATLNRARDTATRAEWRSSLADLRADKFERATNAYETRLDDASAAIRDKHAEEAHKIIGHKREMSAKELDFAKRITEQARRERVKVEASVRELKATARRLRVPPDALHAPGSPEVRSIAAATRGNLPRSPREHDKSDAATKRVVKELEEKNQALEEALEETRAKLESEFGAAAAAGGGAEGTPAAARRRGGAPKPAGPYTEYTTP